MRTITFYSYKGGVGRSLLVANCALYLAQLGFRIVALDLDLEAPGLHYKFRSSLPEGFAPKHGIVDLIDNYATRNELYTSLNDASFEVPLDDIVLEPGQPAPSGRLRVIPAGAAPSFDYWRRVANIDWKRFLYDDDATGVEFFLDLKDRIAEEFTADILLIDSRTGITEIGNVATSVLADQVVCIVADTPENLEGSRAVLRGLRRHRRLSDEAPIEIKIAVSRPHASQAISERLERIRAFFEEPADMLEATLDVGTPYPLTYAPEVEEKEHLVVNADFVQQAQLQLDYIALAEEIVPEPLWQGIPSAWTPRGNSPYPGSVWNYARLALQQPHVPIDGLYRRGRRCSIVVPGFGAETRASDGKPLSEWFASEKTLGVPLNILDRIPDGAVRVADPSLDDLIGQRDFPRVLRQVDAELCLRLPRTFPEFRCRDDGSGASLTVEVERPLLADERAILRREFTSLHYGSMQRLVVRENASVATEEPRFRFPKRQGDIDLIPSRRLPTAFSTRVRELVRQDEEVWMQSRHAIHRGEIRDPAAVLPPWRKGSKARLLASNGTFANPHARNLLPLCDQLLLGLPLSDRMDSEFAAMGFTRREFITLASEGRIIVLLPQAIDRYDAVLLNELAQDAPDALVFSRSLCASTMIELRRRLYPWFFPGFDLRQRYERLHRASTRVPNTSNALGVFDLPAFSTILSHLWSRGEWHTHEKGGMAGPYLGGGFGTLLSDYVQRTTGRDLMLESVTAGASVECAAALGAAIVPMHRPEFSLLGLTTIGAGLLSSLSSTFVPALKLAAFKIPTDQQPPMELARLDTDELRNGRALIAAMIDGTAAPSAALRNVAKAAYDSVKSRVVPEQAHPSLSFTVPRLRGLDDAMTASGFDNAALRVWRDRLAGGDLADDAPDGSEQMDNLPSIVVGSLEPAPLP